MVRMLYGPLDGYTFSRPYFVFGSVSCASRPQFVYWSWFSNSLYHGSMAVMQGVTDPSLVYKRIADVLWETQKAQWVFWIPVQLLNFRYVPVRHQLNVVLLTSIVWTALLSAWYPPEAPASDPVAEEKHEEIIGAASHD